LLILAIETCGAFSDRHETSVKRATLEKRYKHVVLGDVSNSSHEEEQPLRAHAQLAIHRPLWTAGCGGLQFVVVAFGD
jgi:hypothetical protein